MQMQYHDPNTVQDIFCPDHWQGRKNAWIFLTPNFMLSTFLQGFHTEIDEDDHKKPVKYVCNMSKITISVSNLFQPLKMLIFYHIFRS